MAMRVMIAYYALRALTLGVVLHGMSSFGRGDSNATLDNSGTNDSILKFLSYLVKSANLDT
jgi:hypothetical protein